MAKAVKLKDIVDALEYPEDWRVYLNKETGEIICVTEEDQSLLDMLEEGEEDVEDLPEWQRKALPKLRENLKAVEGDECIALPSQFDIHEWEIMRRFALSVKDGENREQLLNAIHGAGAFRYFKDTVHRFDLAESWYRFRDRAIEAIAIDWLEANEIPFERE